RRACYLQRNRLPARAAGSSSKSESSSTQCGPPERGARPDRIRNRVLAATDRDDDLRSVWPPFRAEPPIGQPAAQERAASTGGDPRILPPLPRRQCGRDVPHDLSNSRPPFFCSIAHIHRTTARSGSVGAGILSINAPVPADRRPPNAVP